MSNLDQLKEDLRDRAQGAVNLASKLAEAQEALAVAEKERDQAIRGRSEARADFADMLKKRNAARRERDEAQGARDRLADAAKDAGDVIRMLHARIEAEAQAKEQARRLGSDVADRLEGMKQERADLRTQLEAKARIRPSKRVSNLPNIRRGSK